MSDYFNTVRAILAATGISASTKLVLIYLFDRQGGNGHSWPSINAIAVGCGLARSTVVAGLAELSAAGFISVTRASKPSARESNQYTVNLQRVQNPNQSAPSTGTKIEPELVRISDQSEGNQSENRTRTGTKIEPELVRISDPNVSCNGSLNDPHNNSSSHADSVRLTVRLAVLLRDLILARQPKARERRADMDDWAGDIDKLIRIDGHDPQEIEAVIRWCQADPFWQGNIRSGRKLREKYDTLEGQMRRPLRGANRRQTYDRDYSKQVSSYGTTIQVD